MSDAIDPAKEAARELHGLIRDGRRLERDLKANLEEARRDITSLGTEAAQQYIDVLNDLLRAHVAQITTAIDKANNLLSVRAAYMAGMKTPEEFMADIIKGLTPRVAALLEDIVTAAACEAAVKTCKDLHAPPPKQGRKRQPDKLPPAVVAPIIPSSDPGSLLINRRG